MAIKSYKEMRAIDVTPYVKERDGHKYLPWQACVELLRSNGANYIHYEPCVNENGSALIMSDQVFCDKNGSTNRCYEVRVKVTIDDLEFIVQYPIMNGSNPVKDNLMSQQRVHTAIQRAFVKGVATHTGLGFSLWLDDVEEKSPEDDIYTHNVMAVKERLQRYYTAVIRKGMSTKDIADAVGMTEDQVKVLFTFPDQLAQFEAKLITLL